MSFGGAKEGFKRSFGRDGRVNEWKAACLEGVIAIKWQEKSGYELLSAREELRDVFDFQTEHGRD